MAKFNMADLMSNFSPPPRSDAKEDTLKAPAWEIQMIPLDKIIPSEKNKYGIRGVEELAESIRESGLLHNLVVRKRPGADTYELISGERRYRALKQLRDSGESKWECAPCKVETSNNDTFAELQLLMANLQTRELTDYEKVYQAQRAKELLLELKKQGHTFKGRTRENVACLLGVSNAQIGRMESIWKHLHPEAMQAFKDGKIGISAAYELSRLDKPEQAAALQKSATQKPVQEPAPEKPKGESKPEQPYSGQDLQDLRSIARLFPHAEKVLRTPEGILMILFPDGERIGICCHLFPTLPPGAELEITIWKEEKH